MCGLFGFVAKQGRNVDLDRLATIATATEQRGRDAFGLVWTTTAGGLGTYKRPGAATDGLDDLLMVDGATIIAGHCRWATHGCPSNNRNNHPHAAGRGYLVHNGTVQNHEALAKKYRLARETECDTEVLARLVNRTAGTILQRTAWAAEQAVGKLAVLGVWANPGRMILVRNGNPLYFGQNEDGFYFGSFPVAIPGAKLLRNAHACQLRLEAAEIEIQSLDLQAA